jgi:type I restriction enzyme S subunit
MSWTKHATADLISEKVLEIGDGYRAKNSEMAEDGVPFVRAGDVNGRVNTLETDLLSVASAKKVGRKRSMAGDVVMTTKGTIGRLAFVKAGDPDFIYSPQLCFWRSLDTEVIDPRWLFYGMRSQEMLNQISWSAGQTDMAPYVSLTDQRTAFNISLPAIEDQREIAAILGALDDKIELNRKTAATLEDMARALYRSWFVDFDPVHAKAAGRAPAHMDTQTATLFPDSFGEDGLPLGWEMSTIGRELLILDSKRIPLSKAQRLKKQGDIPYYGATSVMDHVDDHLFDEVLLLVGEDGSVANGEGKPFTQYIWGKSWVNNHAHVLKGKRFSVEQLKCLFDATEISAFITGAVQLKLNQGNMTKIPYVFAGDAVHSKFDELISPWFEKVRQLSDENQTLVVLRDTLLPRLMSGELRVGEATEQVEAVA